MGYQYVGQVDPVTGAREEAPGYPTRDISNRELPGMAAERGLTVEQFREQLDAFRVFEWTDDSTLDDPGPVASDLQVGIRPEDDDGPVPGPETPNESLPGHGPMEEVTGG